MHEIDFEIGKRLESSLRLVVLNCCDSARGSSSLAKRLVLSGIPAVIAMQFPISDQAAVELSSAFYSALANGEPVDGAVTHARIRIQNRSNIEWGIPVLYMRTPDGRIFEKRLTHGASSSSTPSMAVAAVPARRISLHLQRTPLALPLGISRSKPSSWMFSRSRNCSRTRRCNR